MLKFDLKCPTHITFARIAVFILYLTSGELGLLVALPGTNVTPIWPPSGFALAATLVCGYGVWPGIFLGSLLLNLNAVHALDVQFYPIGVLVVSAITALGASLQAAVGAWLIKYFIHAAHPFTNTVDVIKFCFLALLSCFINSNIGTSSLALSGLIPWSFYLTVWWTWWFGDAAGILIITPLMLVWRHLPRAHLSTEQILEFIGLVFSISAITYLNVFYEHLTFLFIPCLFWAGIRFRLHGATAINFLISIIVIFLTIRGTGPFASESLAHSLTLLVVFITVITVTILSLTAEFFREPKLVDNRWEGNSLHPFKNFFKRWFSRYK